MPIIETDNPALKDLQGIHLWHTGLSTCSQRVRIVLSELGQSFESNIVNLHAGENASDWYQAIHPGGVVPALVHDGRVVIESIDIIDYLEQQFGPGKLRPSDPGQLKLMFELMKYANEAQGMLKLLTFEFLFRVGKQMSTEEAALFQKNLHNDKLTRPPWPFEGSSTTQTIRKKRMSPNASLVR